MEVHLLGGVLELTLTNFTFQSGYVQIEWKVLEKIIVDTLHSNLVMFKWGLYGTNCRVTCLYIPIWLCPNFYCIPLSNEKLSFTFQSGYVQIALTVSLQMRTADFTFQSGYIQILMAHNAQFDLKFTLHSNLVIFKSYPSWIL